MSTIFQDANAPQLERWFARGRRTGHTHLFVWRVHDLDLTYVQYLQATATQARAQAHLNPSRSLGRLVAVLHLQSDFVAQFAQGQALPDDEALCVYGDELPGAGPNVVGLAQAREQRAPTRKSSLPGKAPALEAAVTLAELASWKLHWLTMDAHSVITSWEEALKDVRVLLCDDKAQDKLRASGEALTQVVSKFFAFVQELSLIARSNDRGQLLQEIKATPRYTSFYTTLERAQATLQALQRKLHEREIARFEEGLLVRMDRDY